MDPVDLFSSYFGYEVAMLTLNMLIVLAFIICSFTLVIAINVAEA